MGIIVTRIQTTPRKPSAPRKSARKPAFDSFAYLAELGATIPEHELKLMPRDGAKNFDHYLDGSPMQK